MKTKRKITFTDWWFEHDSLESLMKAKGMVDDRTLVLSSYWLPIDHGAESMREAAKSAKANGMEIAAFDLRHELGVNSPDTLPLKLAIVAELGVRGVIFSLPKDYQLKSDSPEYAGLVEMIKADLERAYADCTRAGMEMWVEFEMRYSERSDAVMALVMPLVKAKGIKLCVEYQIDGYDWEKSPGYQMLQENCERLAYLEIPYEEITELKPLLLKLPEDSILAILPSSFKNGKVSAALEALSKVFPEINAKKGKGEK